MFLPPGPISRADLVRIDLDLSDSGGERRDALRVAPRSFRPSRQDELPTLVCLGQGAAEDVRGRSLDLDVHLDRGHAVVVPATLKSMSPR